MAPPTRCSCGSTMVGGGVIRHMGKTVLCQPPRHKDRHLPRNAAAHTSVDPCLDAPPPVPEHMHNAPSLVPPPPACLPAAVQAPPAFGLTPHSTGPSRPAVSVACAALASCPPPERVLPLRLVCRCRYRPCAPSLCTAELPPRPAATSRVPLPLPPVRPLAVHR